MARSLLHDTHIHLEMLLEKLKIGENFRDYQYSKKSQNQTSLQLNNEQKIAIDEALINHQFVIQSTVSTDNFDLVWQLFKTSPKIYFLLGSHPELVNKDFNLEIYLNKQNQYLEEINPSKLCGIGEVGLDYYYTKKPDLIELQKKLFRSQIELAIKLNLPLVIHCRDAFEDLLEILNQYPKIWGNFLIHCFTGSKKNIQDILKLKGSIALGGIITYSKTEALSKAVEYCPLSNIMIETDAPYLTPLSYRGNKICLPKYILATVEKIAQIKDITEQDILDFSKHNTFRLFPMIQYHFGDSQAYLSEDKINE